METRWRDTIVLDYEVDFPAATTIELALYSVGAARFSTVVLNWRTQLGNQRRPGILEIPEVEYERALAEFADGCFNLKFVYRLAALFQRICQRLAHLNGELASINDTATEEEADAVIRNTIDVMADLMAFHFVNWAIPFDRIEEFIAHVIGDPNRARAHMMKLLVPVTPAHLTDFLEIATRASHDMRSGRWTERKSVELELEIGHLQAPGLLRGRLSEKDAISEYVRSLSVDDLLHFESMMMARENAIRDRNREMFEFFVECSRSASILARCEAVTAICRLAAEEEEQRRRWQSRSLRNARRVASLLTSSLDTFLPPECGSGVEGPLDGRPLYDTSSEFWGWMRAVD